MPDFLTHPLWTPLGVVTATLLGLAALWLARRPKKRLQYNVLSVTSLVSPEALHGRIQVLLDGKPTGEVHLILIQIMNTGNTPIASADFETPLKMFFGEHGTTKILEANVISTKPESLSREITLDYGDFKHNQVALDPLLLNAGDSFTIKVLASASAELIKRICVEGRIIGVQKIIASGRTGFFKHTPETIALGFIAGFLFPIGLLGINPGPFKFQHAFLLTVSVLSFARYVYMTLNQRNKTSNDN